MIVLAIDTAGVDCSAAVYDGTAGRLLGECSEMIGRGHAEKLMATIDAALDAASIDLAAVDRIAVTVGPGSFTGIRVGVAAARGLALSLGIEAVGISTLPVLAHMAADEGAPLLAAMDAKRGEIYLQRFSAAREPLSTAEMGTLDDFKVLAASGAWQVTGSARQLLSDPGAATETDRFAIAVVAKLGAEAKAAGKPKPLYLRGPDAKPQTGFAVSRA
ncbi:MULTISPECIES: tRNA (adenosine(37)-N6)-threonylcarbamoyltransferase complex dimerization subunit type 1 TsaB [Alphaproteobacteria]|uniref:tRNA (Adenosine(37)-N6)-threonylcarbamoyltransferase complex dimerization subunit type 1 TsaB n=2 Tax=Alphaproteobacteria TaxID=28211 RepID=A0A512HDW5_9HYPH|nr:MULTISPECIES: tRNA (adenosine(37)-N6)-threonylcarbamoyltransferase complex dimerization subunit type 1 TsaB [Alphaproteobacteria]GEO83637.1 tRNA (adenosine(37)-N6)-threonylcarbamoyltransferase complex dimerization subunit type 1 TsaB [Ciceribacter naphthalenivorans]GLR24211.1 tRNA (adenosine(37)-N6)-threonylcarbamoyltransferase complex dimerization subunit type 1 TsaB [Ciceribacter naphthalenivorans]GLT07067.1 tRNA (adenosine(37)-N6)-threonylcarbamoyltransferase complex dimerization subunit t